MKPVYLKMTEFESYRSMEKPIDFTAFEDSDLFLICGPTGAGKTTIFDAIKFALYGESSGGERKYADLRNSTADPDTPTQVDFVFSLNDRVFRINRTFTDKSLSVRLRELSPEGGLSWENIDACPTKYDEQNEIKRGSETPVNQKIVDLIGLDSKKFSQVAMISQGKFSDALKSKSKEKEIIFRTLFGTEKFNSLVEKIDEDHSEAKARREDQKKAIRSSCLNFVCLTPGGEGQDEEELAWDPEKIGFDEYAEDEENRIKSIQEVGSAADERSDALDAKLLESRILPDMRTLIEHDEAIQKKLDESIQELEQEIIRCEKAIESARKLAQNRKNAEDLKTKIGLYSAEIESKKAGLDKAEQDSRERIRDLSDKSSAIDQTRAKYSQLEEKEEQLADAGARRARISASIPEGLKESVRSFEERYLKKAAAGEIESNRFLTDRSAGSVDFTVSLDRGALNEEQQRAWKIAEGANHIGKALSKMEEAWPRFCDANDELLKEEEDLGRKSDDYEKKYRSSYSWILAKDLKVGDRCPVCGRIVENITDLPVEAHISEKEVNESKKALDKAKAQRDTAQENIKNIKARLLGFLQTVRDNVASIGLSDSASEQDILAYADELERSLHETDGRSLHETEGRSLHETDDQRFRTSITTIREISSAWAESASAIVSDAAYANECWDYIDDRKELESCIKHVDECDAEISKIKEGIAALKGGLDYESWEKAEAAKQKNSKEIEKINDDLGKARQEIQKIEDEKKTLEGQLKQLQMQIDDSSAEEIDVKAEEARRNQVSKDRDYLKDINSKRITPRLSLEREAERSIDRSLDDFKKAEDAYEMLDPLFRCLCGKKTGIEKLSLEDFVLQRYFEMILSKTDRYMDRMTSDRYRLRHQKESTKAYSQQFILEIEDRWNNCSRPIDTFSGGEMFQASLALALGLSDAARAEGKKDIVLDSLFIDEGFGTLDEENLQIVENLLKEELKGKTVGIISHVGELKEAIPARIEVSQVPGKGSRAEIITD